MSGSDGSNHEEQEEVDAAPPRKRRKVKNSDDLETQYLNRLSREQAKEDRPRHEDIGSGSNDDANSQVLEESDLAEIPKHESLTKEAGSEARETAKRTVFLGNVSVDAIKEKSSKKALLQHLSSILSDLPDQGQPHTIESIRFRSTAYADAGIPKKAAFAKRDLMESTTKSTNAYVVYSTEIAARKAARLLNGTVVLQRHLRVDHVAHPAPVDHRRCVFVGNLAFVDEENGDDVADAQKKKSKPAGDAEEGLWQVFSAAGKIESVRIPRDKATRVSKGFAYVQFQDENAVEAALIKFNEKKFPPLLPRKLRVTRAMKFSKSLRRERAAARNEQEDKRRKTGPKRPKGPRMQPHTHANKGLEGIRKPEAFVFEGHRASSNSGSKRKPKSKKNFGKRPVNRSARRAAAFKESGGKRKREA